MKFRFIWNRWKWTRLEIFTGNLSNYMFVYFLAFFFHKCVFLNFLSTILKPTNFCWHLIVLLSVASSICLPWNMACLLLVWIVYFSIYFQLWVRWEWYIHLFINSFCHCHPDTNFLSYIKFIYISLIWHQMLSVQFQF